MTIAEPEYMTVGDVARAADPPVSCDLVRTWERSGRLPALKLASGQRIFRRDEVLRFLADRAAARTGAR